MRVIGASRRLWFLVFSLAAAMLVASIGAAQSAPYERTFSQSKAAVEKTLKQLQSSASGRLPTLDGFTRPSDRALDRFQRGYYQCATQVTSTPAGGTTVRVTAKITAWYSDPASSKSGYQELPSNGRLETDFLDRLEDALGGSGSAAAANIPVNSPSSQPKSKSVASAPKISVPTISAPQPSDSISNAPLASSKSMPENSPFKVGNPVNSDLAASLATQKAVADKHMEDLTKEAKGLEEILRNQAHPKNLVAVKKSGTPVLGNPIEGAKALFLATAEDEFEILDMNANWVHVRISGLSRGWIRRSAVEMPDNFPSEAKVQNSPAQASAETFQVKNEEIASFPGTWEPLRGKTVKILTVQNAGTSTTDTGSRAKLEYAKSLFGKEYAELTQAPTTAVGVVLIFDSEDGGMAAATLPTLQQWKAGSLSDQAFWRRCFLDPPETFSSQTAQ
ncbi:MAG TPA: hypothetical protein VGP35_14045 [Terriglobales bacterium]|jgi:hypothetical protein|nr:hypothetical protein [Terriglobales bacterium]